MDMDPKQRVLIVEDDSSVAESLCIVLEDVGFGICRVARTVQEAVDAAHEHRPSLILMALELPGRGDGVDAAQQIHAGQDCPIIFLTSNTDLDARRRIFQDKPAGILTKPFTAPELISTIQTVVQGRPPNTARPS
jgi:two-component system response regulator LytT